MLTICLVITNSVQYLYVFCSRRLCYWTLSNILMKHHFYFHVSFLSRLINTETEKLIRKTALPSTVMYWYLSTFSRLKAADTIGKCQRLAFTVGVSQHMHKITNLWKFELNRSSNLQDNNERKKHPCHTKLCAFRCLISRPQVLNLRSQNQICEKLFLSRKLCHFRGSRFSQCFFPSTSPHYSLPRKVLCQ